MDEDELIAELQAECEDLIEEYRDLVDAGLLESVNLEDIPVPYQGAPGSSNWQVNGKVEQLPIIGSWHRYSD